MKINLALSSGPAMKPTLPSAPRGNLPAPLNKVVHLAVRHQSDPWRVATEAARATALARETAVLLVRTLVEQFGSQNKAVDVLLARAEAGQLNGHHAKALATVAKAGRAAPSRSVLFDWCAAYNEAGVHGLLPQHKGRVVQAREWYAYAIEYYNQPSKPDMAAVHRLLIEQEGFNPASCTYEQVRGYLNSLPAQYGALSPARIGNKLYRLTQKAYVRRVTHNLQAGDIYMADGYRADVYIAHPVTGDIWRPELTVAIDLYSRVVVGWRADEHESAIAVQNMWAEAFARWGHVPPILYIDNGSGYKNKFTSDDLTGFYGRAGVQEVIHALPDNPHGKGHVERFFRIVKDDFFKMWQPAFYCGHDADPDALSKTVRECKAGRLQPPSLAQFTDAFNEWLRRYAHRPHPEDKRVSRLQRWQGLQPIPPHACVLELKRQAVTRKVRRAALQHGPRAYSHPELHAWNGQEVVLEYDLMNDAIGVVRTLDGRLICDAHLVRSIDVVGINRMDEARQKAAKAALKRLDKHRTELLARAGQVLDLDATVDAIESSRAPLLELDALAADEDGTIDLDLESL